MARYRNRLLFNELAEAPAPAALAPDLRGGTSEHATGEATLILPHVARDHRVLIVDDEQTVLDAAAEYLGAYGFVVDTARELEEAEALLSAFGYSLVIADVRLTGVQGREGLELLRFVRQHCPDARVIVMTAHASADLEREARRRGAEAFLEKPLPLSDLLYEAHRLLMDRAGDSV